MSHGFKAMFYKLVRKAVASGELASPFQFRDLRAKAATDSVDIEAAQRLLGHSNPATTARVYRRKPEEVDALDSQEY